MDEEKALSFLRRPKVNNKFKELFQGSGPSALFVHFQPKHPEHKQPEERRDSSRASSPVLSVSYGDSTLMNSKCCYFLRRGTAVDPSVANDTALFYGEMLDSPLETIKALLTSTYAPMFAESNEWGSTNEEQKAEFNEELNKFVRNLTSAVESISSGLELRHLDSTHVECLESSTGTVGGGQQQQNAAPAMQSPEAMAQLEDLLGEWCQQVEDFIDTREQEEAAAQNGTPGVERVEGPKGEIEHWRSRTQHLASIIEQLKRKDCRYVVGVLSSYTKGSNDPSKLRTTGLLRRWKQIDISTTEAVNEAKDNLKYLSTLRRFIEPLYSGTAQSIIDTLPALINSIKVRDIDEIPLAPQANPVVCCVPVLPGPSRFRRALTNSLFASLFASPRPPAARQMIYTISRYYNTEERVAHMLSKITDQMIIRCRENIIEGVNEDMWQEEPNELVRMLDAGIRLNEAYREQYRLTKRKLERSSSNGKL